MEDWELNIPKDYYEELDRVEREGYDKTKFCNAECVLMHCCDFCYHYDFKPGDCGCYLDAGQCDLHGKKDPEDGNNCKDFICFRVKEEQEFKIIRSQHIKERRYQAQQGVNICESCWANIFCAASTTEEEDAREETEHYEED